MKGLRALALHAAVLAGFALLALGFCHPLASHFSKLYMGHGGDMVIGIWNMWYFRYAVTVLKTNPLWTEMLYWPYGANLILHHDTLVNDVLAYFLLPSVGAPATYNLMYVSSLVLSAYGVFLLLLDWGMDASVSFVCGAAFAFSPAMLYLGQSIEGLDLLCVHALPFYVWTLWRAARSRRAMDSFWAALCLSWAWCYNYYHFLFCVLLAVVFYLWLERPLKPSLAPRAGGPALGAAKRAAELLAAAAFLWAARSVWSGQRQFHGGGSARTLLLYVAPYVCFWAALGLRLALSWSPALGWDPEAAKPKALLPYASVGAFWAALNVPLIWATVAFMRGGDYGGPPHTWRGGGDAVDLVWFLFPNPYHAWWGGAVRRLAARLPLGPMFPPLGWVLLAGAGWLWLRRRREDDRWTGLFAAGAGFSLLMSLGPWLRLCGVDTFLPMPFYFIHQLPIFSNMQVAHRFNIYVVLFLCLLLAALLRSLQREHPGAARWLPWAAFLLLLLEDLPAARPLIRIEPPAVLARLAARPDGAMLTLPTGAMFNGLGATATVGTPPSIVMQTFHHKPLVGGYLTRVSRRTYEDMRRDPVFSALLAAQGGTPPAPLLSDARFMSRYLSEERLRYVLVDDAQTPEALRAALASWPLRRIDSQDGLELYEVRGPEPR
ncbi:MAG: hypothetical protein KGL53_10530 [Elusimicrobia bacterium]|nr:hypothetical protein [Elusimicrobiota bacterium]